MIWIVLLIILIPLSEAFNDHFQDKEVQFYIKAFKNKVTKLKYIALAKQSNRYWHIASAINYTLYMILVYLTMQQAFFSKYILLIISLMILSRGSIFNTLLNKLRGRTLWYRGKNGIDGYLRPYAQIVFWLINVIFVVNLILILK